MRYRPIKVITSEGYVVSLNRRYTHKTLTQARRYFITDLVYPSKAIILKRAGRYILVTRDAEQEFPHRDAAIAAALLMP